MACPPPTQRHSPRHTETETTAGWSPSPSQGYADGFDRSRPSRLGGPARTVWPLTPTDRPPESGLDVRTVGAPQACRRRPARGPCGSNRPHAPASHPSQTPPSRASLHVSSTTPELYDPRQGPQPLRNSASSSEKRGRSNFPCSVRRSDVCERLQAAATPVGAPTRGARTPPPPAFEPRRRRAELSPPPISSCPRDPPAPCGAPGPGPGGKSKAGRSRRPHTPAVHTSPLQQATRRTHTDLRHLGF